MLAGECVRGRVPARGWGLSRREPMRRIALLALTLLVAAACGATRYTELPYKELDPYTEYCVEDQPDGFTAYVWYGRYQFASWGARIAEEGKAKLLLVVKETSENREKPIRNVDELSITSNVGRNFWGTTSWSGMVRCYYR